VRRAAASEAANGPLRQQPTEDSCLEHAWYLQWRGLPHPMPVAADTPERTGKAGEVCEAGEAGEATGAAGSSDTGSSDAVAKEQKAGAKLTAALRLPRQVAAAWLGLGLGRRPPPRSFAHSPLSITPGGGGRGVGGERVGRLLAHVTPAL